MAKKSVSKKSISSLNDDQCQLAELIETLTHTGLKTLDATNLKKVKDICKKSDKNVDYTYLVIVNFLEKNHSEVRFSAFQLCDEIFRRSHCFRQLVLDNLRHIFDLTAETNADIPLPKPRAIALDLKKLSLKTFSEWNKLFGPRYKKLSLGFNYLKQCKKVDFGALQLQTNAERAREEENRRRSQAINKERAKKVESELNEFNSDICSAVKSLMSCLDLLLPKPEEFFISLNEESDLPAKEHDISSADVEMKSDVKQETDDSSDGIDSDCDDYAYVGLRSIGGLNSKYSVQINLNVEDMKYLKETPENEAILQNVRDQVKLITINYLPRVKGWLQILTKMSEHEEMKKKIVDLKTSMELSLEKYERLNIKTPEDDCVSTDSELEEVKDIDRDMKADHAKLKKRKRDVAEWSILSKEENSKDPTTMQATLLSFENQKVSTKSKSDDSSVKPYEPNKPSTSKLSVVPSTSNVKNDEINDRKRKLLAVAPKLPFDIDLYHWEDEKLETPTLIPTAIDQNKFWSSVSGDDFMEIAVPEGASALRTRVIEFTGEFKPVTKSCRARLANGKLCPRKDRFKCPFHGIIVPRDEAGKCINPEDEERIQKAEEEKRVPDWQDPKLLKEIKEATGIDLKMPDKGKRKKVNKHPGLTDIKATENTVKNRLSKKLFNRASVKRVAQTLDSIDHRKFRDKYGDQFHYMHDTA